MRGVSRVGVARRRSFGRYVGNWTGRPVEDAEVRAPPTAQRRRDRDGPTTSTPEPPATRRPARLPVLLDGAAKATVDRGAGGADGRPVREALEHPTEGHRLRVDEPVSGRRRPNSQPGRHSNQGEHDGPDRAVSRGAPPWLGSPNWPRSPLPTVLIASDDAKRSHRGIERSGRLRGPAHAPRVVGSPSEAGYGIDERARCDKPMMRQELAGSDASNLSPAERDKARLAVIDEYLAASERPPP
jgi:hypothetical protein